MQDQKQLIDDNDNEEEMSHLFAPVKADDESMTIGIEDNEDSYTVRLRVDGMMCQKNCGTTVKNALSAIPGATSSSASHPTSSATVTIHKPTFHSEECPSTDPVLLSSKIDEAAADAVECVGFDARLLRPDEKILADATPTPSVTTADETLSLTEIDDSATPKSHKIVLGVEGMSCAVCTGRVEKTLLRHPSVAHASVNLSTHRATVVLSTTSTPDLIQSLASAVTEEGYPAKPFVQQKSMRDNAARLEEAQNSEFHGWRSLFLISLLFTVPLVILHYSIMSHGDMGPLDWEDWTCLYLSTPVQFGVGRRFYVAAWRGLKGRSLGMDFLVMLGTSCAYFYSVIAFNVKLFCPYCYPHLQTTFETSAMLLTFVTLGKTLEAYAKGQTAGAIQKLMELQPREALHVTNYDPAVPLRSLATTSVPTEKLKVGDVVMVTPGARVPTDGTLLARDGDGEVSYIDESAFSGEPFPVPKKLEDSLYGASVNQLSLLLLRVTHTGNNTALAKIVSLIEDAQANKAPIQAYADILAGVFAPFVIVMSLITFSYWMAFGENEDRWFVALMSAISVIVVACPCAMGLATPTAVMVGTGVGAKHGLLIKGGAVLEEAHAVTTVVLDKTGTLTEGIAVMDTMKDFVPEEVKQGAPKSEQNVGLWLAVCCESGSEHPIARAIVSKARGLWGEDIIGVNEGVSVEQWRIVPGNGVECIVKKTGWGERLVRVGKKEFACQGWEDTDIDAELHLIEMREKGNIAFHVGVSSNVQLQMQQTQFRPVAIFGVVDPLKMSARSTCIALRNKGIDVYMCTGDHELTAQAVAKQVGISECNVRASMSPEMKADFITHLINQNEGLKKGKVAVVGDGINDSVALARANVGIAIGAGTEVAMEAADIVLIKSDLHDVVVALDLSNVVFSRIKINFVWAMGYNIIALPFAAGAFSQYTSVRLSPAFAGLMMAFSSVSVVTSSLLLRMYKKPIICEDGQLERRDACSRIIRALYMKHNLGGKTVGNKREKLYGKDLDENEIV